MTGPVNTAHNTGCTLPAAQLSLQRYCTRQPPPCTFLTVSHHIHTLPPDVHARLAYQRSLVTTYGTSDLCRPQRDRNRQDPRHAFTVTRSDAGVDLPGFGRGRSDMSHDEDDGQTARGTLGSRARRTAARHHDDESSPLADI